MIWIQESDLNALSTENDIEVLSKSSDEVLDKAELMTIDYFKGFLTRYAIDTIFAEIEELPDPDTRNQSLLMFVIDVLLYNLYGSMPDRLIPDIRVERKKEADDWLKLVQKGVVNPNLPTVDTDEETDTQNPFRFGSNTRVSSAW